MCIHMFSYAGVSFPVTWKLLYAGCYYIVAFNCFYTGSRMLTDLGFFLHERQYKMLIRNADSGTSEPVFKYLFTSY